MEKIYKGEYKQTKQFCDGNVEGNNLDYELQFLKNA
jgi:hypothetical protein